MLKYVYAVQVIDKHSEESIGKVSCEAYKSLQEAQEFIESRSDKPEKVSGFIYESKNNHYLIGGLKIFN